MSSTTTTTPFLLTGVTGGLGAKILHDMLHKHHVSPQDIIATSRSESSREKFESQGLKFAVADYKRPGTLEAAFAGVRELLFMSSSERDSVIRSRDHGNVVEAAKKVGVERVWYISLAFGGYTDTSKIGFQAAHYETENMLRDSGINFISLRAGVYSDAFPLFLNWYPSSKSVLMPKITPSVEESKIAFTTRDELGEGIATLLAKGIERFPGVEPKGDKRIILLTATKTYSLPDLVGAINAARPSHQKLRIEYLEPQEWIEASASDDEGGKGKAWFESRLVFAKGVSSGDAEVMSDALEILLGRKPETGVQAVERFLREDGEYRWHQNHIVEWKGLDKKE